MPTTHFKRLEIYILAFIYMFLNSVYCIQNRAIIFRTVCKAEPSLCVCKAKPSLREQYVPFTMCQKDSGILCWLTACFKLNTKNYKFQQSNMHSLIPASFYAFRQIPTHSDNHSCIPTKTLIPIAISKFSSCQMNFKRIRRKFQILNFI